MGRAGGRSGNAARSRALIGQVVRLARVRRSDDGVAEAPEDWEARLRALEQRISHLEALLEGLQDSVHREAVRHDERIADLEQKVEPAQMARELSRDAREHGV